MRTDSKIIGSAVCPRGRLLDHSGDECRAFLGQDGRVSCVVCARISERFDSPPLQVAALHLPWMLRQLIADLISAAAVDQPTFRLLSVSNQLSEMFDEPDFHDRAAAAVAHQATESLDVTRITLRLQEDYLTVSITATPAALEAAQFDNRAQPLPAELKRKLPPGVLKAAADLNTYGFSFVLADLDSAMPRVLFRKGDAYNAIQADLHWIR